MAFRRNGDRCHADIGRVCEKRRNDGVKPHRHDFEFAADAFGNAPQEVNFKAHGFARLGFHKLKGRVGAFGGHAQDLLVRGLSTDKRGGGQSADEKFLRKHVCASPQRKKSREGRQPRHLQRAAFLCRFSLQTARVRLTVTA